MITTDTESQKAVSYHSRSQLVHERREAERLDLRKTVIQCQKRTPFAKKCGVSRNVYGRCAGNHSKKSCVENREIRASELSRLSQCHLFPLYSLSSSL